MLKSHRCRRFFLCRILYSPILPSAWTSAHTQCDIYNFILCVKSFDCHLSWRSYLLCFVVVARPTSLEQRRLPVFKSLHPPQFRWWLLYNKNHWPGQWFPKRLLALIMTENSFCHTKLRPDNCKKVKGGYPSVDNSNGLAHMKWNCKCHMILFAQLSEEGI